MDFQFKKWWKRWVIRRCKHDYVQLPRYRIRKTNSNPCCKFVQGFYCASDSLISFMFVILFFVLVVLHLRGFTFVDFQYIVGWIPQVVISVSTLDYFEQVNFPNGDPQTSSANSYDAEEMESALKLAKSGKVLLWKVDGYTRYVNSFDTDLNDALGMFAKLPSGKQLKLTNESGYGFWVYKFGPSSSTTNNASNFGSISALRITEHIDNVTPEEVEVAVAIRAYVEGEATIVVKYEHSLSKHVHAEPLHQEVFRNKGFCYKILELPFEKRIDSIIIRPTSTNLRRHGIVVVDKILIVVGKRGVTESMIHTLVPNNWC